LRSPATIACRRITVYRISLPNHISPRVCDSKRKKRSPRRFRRPSPAPVSSATSLRSSIFTHGRRPAPVARVPRALASRRGGPRVRLPTAGRGSRPACPRCRDGQIEYLDRRARLCPLKKNLCPRFDYALRVQIVKSYSTARATPRCYAHTLRVEGVSAVAPPWGAGPESAPEHAPLRRGWRPLEEPEIGRYPARTQP
jgi:hypothetical protein